MERYFLIPMAILPLPAVYMFLSRGDVKHAVYWLLVAAINASAASL